MGPVNVKYVRLSDGCAIAVEATTARMAAAQPSRPIDFRDIELPSWRLLLSSQRGAGAGVAATQVTGFLNLNRRGRDNVNWRGRQNRRDGPTVADDASAICRISHR